MNLQIGQGEHLATANMQDYQTLIRSYKTWSKLNEVAKKKYGKKILKYGIVTRAR